MPRDRLGRTSPKRPFCVGWDVKPGLGQQHVCVCLQYEKLDEEHKGLFKYVFDVAASNDGGSLCKLCEGVKAHFATEEVSKLIIRFLSFSTCCLNHCHS